MKKFYCLCLLFLSSFAINAQIDDQFDQLIKELYPDLKLNNSVINGNIQLDSILVTEDESNGTIIQSTKYTYDVQNQLSSLKEARFKDQTILYKNETDYTYDMDGRLISQELIVQRDSNSVLTPFSKTTYTYQSDQIDTLLSESYDERLMAYVPQSRNIYFYNQVDQLEEIILETFDEASGIFEPARRTEITYNIDDQEIQRLQIITPGNGIEVPNSRIIREYQNGLLSSLKLEVFDGGWIDFQNTTLAYENQQLREYDLTSFDLNNPNIFNTINISRTFDNNGVVTSGVTTRSNEQGVIDITERNYSYDQGVPLEDLILPFTLNDAFFGYQLFNRQLLQSDSKTTRSGAQDEFTYSTYYWSDISTSVADISKDEVALDAWPNPCNDQLNWKSDVNFNEYKVLNFDGRVLEGGTNLNQLNTQNYKQGKYILYVSNNDQWAKVIWIKD